MPEGPQHYNARYLSRERWLSHVYQVAAIADLKPKRIADVGIGAGGLGSMIRITHPDCRYVGIDIDPALRPDICADATALPFGDNTFDATFCCQILQYLPYSDFGPALAEIRRVTQKRIILSLPDVTPFFYVRAPGLRKLMPALWRGFSLPNPTPRQCDISIHGNHHWEIGWRGYPLRRVLGDIKNAGLRLRQKFRMTERSYWHFFILEA